MIATELQPSHCLSPEFEQLMVDLRGELITVRLYDDGIIVDRPLLAHLTYDIAMNLPAVTKQHIF